MTYKFKVGDKVRVMEGACYPITGSIGNVFEVMSVGSDGDCNLSDGGYYYENDLKLANEKETFDPVHKPSHYNSHPSGIQCIDITKHMGFNLGNVIKYVWRADLKDNAIEDLKKAKWYIENEIEKRENNDK